MALLKMYDAKDRTTFTLCVWSHPCRRCIIIICYDQIKTSAFVLLYKFVTEINFFLKARKQRWAIHSNVEGRKLISGR